MGERDINQGSNSELEKGFSDKSSASFQFPKWVNRVPALILITVTLVLVFVIHLFWYWFSPNHLEVGYEPEQPIPYSHRLHVGELGLDCRYCHSQVENQGHSNIPSIMNSQYFFSCIIIFTQF